MQNRTPSIDDLVALLKKGDASSLAQLRELLELSGSEVASEIGVSEKTLEAWETGVKQPSAKKHRDWKIQLGSQLDTRIAGYLGTNSDEVIHKYWKLIWELVE